MAQAPSAAGAEDRRARAKALWIALPYLSLGIFDALYSGWISDPVWLYWASDVVEHVVLGPVLLWLILRVSKWRAAEIGFAWPPGQCAALRLFGFSAVAMLVLMSPLTDTLTDAMGIAVPISDGGYDYSFILPGDRMLRAASVLYLCATSSLIEEIFYRGVLWRAIAPEGSGVMRQVFFVAFSAALFGASHTEQGLYGVVSTGLWGALCSVMLIATRSLWPLIIGHAATNLYQFRYELLG